MNFRRITLALYKTDDIEEKLNKIKEWCKEKNVKYLQKEFNETFANFLIYGNTKIYEELQDFMDLKIVETNYAKIGNMLDYSDYDLNTFKTMVNKHYENLKESELFHTYIANMIVNINDVYTLNEIKKHILDTSVCKMIDDKILRLNGKPDSYDRYLKNSKKTNRFYFHDDFGVIMNNADGHWVKIEELNELLANNIITLDRTKLEEYNYKKRWNH